MDNLAGLKLVEKLIKENDYAEVQGYILNNTNCLHVFKNNSLVSTVMGLDLEAAEYAQKLIKQKEERDLKLKERIKMIEEKIREEECLKPTEN